MVRTLTILMFLLLGGLVPLTAQVDDRAVLFTVDGDTVTVGEFRRMYLKNLDQTGENYQSPEEYLQLYINFKLKVHAAREAGYDTLKSYRQELARYRSQLAGPYLVDPAILDSLVREGYERLTKELDVYHILVRVGPDEDTTEAWNKIMEIRKKLVAGVSFGEMARAVSDDPSAKTNGGHIGYFTAFQMVYPFETAAYHLKPGELSMPVRTRFGYHLIRLDSIQPNPGQVHVAHIMIAVPPNASEQQKKAARDTINMILDKLRNGADFSEMAQKYSQDYGTARKGGVLPWFGPGRMIPDFADAAFALKEKGELSGPVRTPYGWHIIKLLDKKPLGTFQEMEPEIRKKVKRSDRLRIVRDRYLLEQMKRSHAWADTALLEQYAAQATIEKHHLVWSFPEGTGETPVFTFRSLKVPFKDFYQYMQKVYIRDDQPADAFVKKHFEKFALQKMLEYRKAHLEEEYPEFGSLMKEYAEGILMFDIMDDKVWSKAVEDTAGLRKFYEEHRTRYMTPEKMVVGGMEVLDASRVARVEKEIRKALRKGRSLRTVADKFGRTVKMLPADTLSREGKDVLQGLAWEKGAVTVEDHNGKTVVRWVETILPPQPKPLGEVLGVVTSDYQDYLEKQWLQELKQRYPVKVNREVFDLLKKELEAATKKRQ